MLLVVVEVVLVVVVVLLLLLGVVLVGPTAAVGISLVRLARRVLLSAAAAGDDRGRSNSTGGI